MALVLNDRVKETTNTNGQGNITLAGVAAVNFITFNTGIGTSNTTYYAIVNQGVAEWEVGLGTLSNATTLERTTVIDTSAGNTTKINFTGTTKDVFCTLPASKAVYLDANGVPVGAASAGFAVAMAIAL
jgi:hypothetical protein|tara:strand:+ start:434 stop:820 length:387 start_codon:yes stop_codon:yes gene_type:complete